MYYVVKSQLGDIVCRCYGGHVVVRPLPRRVRSLGRPTTLIRKNVLLVLRGEALAFIDYLPGSPLGCVFSLSFFLIFIHTLNTTILIAGIIHHYRQIAVKEVPSSSCIIIERTSISAAIP
uniref:Uncharacterized protein n=1 Tax=Kalanchoe fedtschenkoi TaxID=63787 RepID=A0A7N0V110_KALFE